MPVKLQLAVTWSTSSFWIAGGRFSSVIWASLLLLLVMVLWLVTLTNLYVSVTVLTLYDFGMAFSSFFNTVLLLCCCCGCCCCTLNACENDNNHPPAQINERTQTINLLKMWYLKQNKKNKKKRHKETKLKSQKWCTHYRTETTSAWLDLTWLDDWRRASASVLAENEIQHYMLHHTHDRALHEVEFTQIFCSRTRSLWFLQQMKQRAKRKTAKICRKSVENWNCNLSGKCMAIAVCACFALSVCWRVTTKFLPFFAHAM